MAQKKLKDYFWIWGHPTNSMYTWFHRGVSTITPIQGVEYMNASNLVYNDLGEAVFDKVLECELAKDLPKVAWVVEDAAKKPENVTELINFAKEYPNITTVIFDDFFAPSNPNNNYTNYTPEMMAGFREQLHEAGLDMWVVIYTENFRQLGVETIRPFLKEFDCVTLWFWNESEILTDYDECVKFFFEETKNQRHMIGCYVYNFGESKAATSEAVLHQLNKGRALIESGKIEGMFIHTNPAFALKQPFEAVEACREWMHKYGDDLIG